MHTESTSHVAFFLPDLSGGGAEQVMVTLANGFADQGISTDFVLTRCEGQHLSKLSSKVRVVDLRASRIFFSLPGLVRYLKAEEPEVLLSTLMPVNIVALMAKYLSRTRTRIVIRVANMVSFEVGTSLKGKIKHWLAMVFYPKADEVIVVSQDVAKDLQATVHISSKRVRVIYNPAIMPEYLEGAKGEVDHPWFQPGEPPVVMGMGRLTRQKDFETLIRAFAFVRRKIPARLLIFGEGEDRFLLETLVQELHAMDDVSLPGYVNNPAPYLNNAAVFASSSMWEGLPGALIQAMALGCPVVSTDCPGGASEVLSGGEYGILVPVRDPSALADAILNVLDGSFRSVDPEWLNQFTLEGPLRQYMEVMGVS